MIVMTIKRPNGQLEAVESNQAGMTDTMFKKIQIATAQAGRGDVLSWELVDDRTDAQREQHAINDMYAAAEEHRDTDNAAHVKMVASADKRAADYAASTPRDIRLNVVRAYTMSNNDVKSSIGRAAQARLESGHGIETVIESMQKTWVRAAIRRAEQ